MKDIIAGFFLLIIIASCGDGPVKSNNLPERSDSAISDSADIRAQAMPANPASADTGKINGIWFLVAILPSDTAAGKVPNINFNVSAKSFTGHTGCNNMRGTFNVSDSTLEINEQIITTKMACTGYNETAFLKNLAKVTGYKFENGMMVLMADGTELSKWTRQPVKPTNKTT